MTASKEVIGTPGDWFFFSGGPGAPRYGDDPTKHAVDHDTESFVREVVQNANDQRLDNGDPVEVRFRFVTLTGDERDEFLRALGWESRLRDQIQQVAEHDTGRGYDRFLDRIEDPDAELRLLVVEDRNTTGLTGQWDEDSNYAALVRDELYSSKQDDTAGGSYGLGKSVLWTFSGASTVLFNSHPIDTLEDVTPPRCIGRTKLPTHELGGVTYQGAGWLCEPHETSEGSRPKSLWDEDAEELAERLELSRPDVSGTSAMVVGYRDPTRDARPDVEELADQFEEAAVKYFWPAIYREDLRVVVETDDEERESDVESVPEIRPFVECFKRRHREGDALSEPGDVAGLDIPMDVPPRADGTETPDGSVRLAARLASPADNDTYLNNIALFRGAGMVVKYYDQSRVAFGDRNFHGVLAAGEARSDDCPTEADFEVDRFLRFSEPPEHDEWTSTENLREQYKRGFRTALDNMFETTRDGLRHLISRNDGSADALSGKVLKRFPIHEERMRSRSTPNPSSVFEIDSNSEYDDDRWRFNGQIEPLEEEFKGWTAEISMQGIGEDGGTSEQVPIDTVRVSSDGVTVNYEGGVARVIAENGESLLQFEGESRPVEDGSTSPVTVGEIRLEIQAELRTSGGD
jgi:hypothetical protein